MVDMHMRTLYSDGDLDSTFKLGIENQFESDSELLLNLIDEVNDSRVKICLDIGHAHANSNMAVENWIETLKDRILYYHLHNNHGKQTILGYNKDDEHLGIDNGTINIEKKVKLYTKITKKIYKTLKSSLSIYGTRCKKFY